MRVHCCQALASPKAHSCERAQVSGKQVYSRGFGARNRAISRKSGPSIGRAMNGLPSKFSYSHRLPVHGLGDEGLLAFFRGFSSALALLSPMTLRALLTMAVVLICGSASAATPAARPAPGTAPAPPMAFYVVKG